MKLHQKGATKVYILDADRESETPTKFHLKRLTWRQFNELNRMTVVGMDAAFEIKQINDAVKAESREMTTDEATRMNELVRIDANFLEKLSEQMARACAFGLERIEDLFDQDGDPWKIAVDEFIELADSGTLRELGQVIIENSKVHGGEDAVKN